MVTRRRGSSPGPVSRTMQEIELGESIHMDDLKEGTNGSSMERFISQEIELTGQDESQGYVEVPSMKASKGELVSARKIGGGVRKWVKSKLAKRPLLNAPFARVLPFELASMKLWELVLVVVVMLGIIGFVWKESVPFLSEATCGELKSPKDCIKLTYRMKKFCQHVGAIVHTSVALTFFPVARNSIVFAVTGLSFDKVIKWHRWIGRLAVLGTLVHGMGFIANWVDEGVFWHKMQHRHNLFGVVGMLVLFCIYCTSLSGVRRGNYKVFWYFHIVMVPLFLASILLHHEKNDFIMKATIPFIVYVFDKLWRRRKVVTVSRMIHSVRRIGTNIIKVQIGQGDDHVTMPESNGGRKECAWIMLNIPFVSKLSYHPFSICDTGLDQDGNADRLQEYEGGKMAIFIKATNKDRWTKSLVNYAMQPNLLEGQQVFVDGPYYGLELPFSLPMYDSIMFLCGGIGITPMIPLFRRLVESLPYDEVRRISFVWSVRDLPLAYEFAETLRICSKNHECVKISLYLSECTDKEPELESCLGSSVNVIYGERPNLPERVGAATNDLISLRLSHVPLFAGLVCGPQAMIEDFFFSVGRAEVSSNFAFVPHLHRETFHF